MRDYLALWIIRSGSGFWLEISGLERMICHREPRVRLTSVRLVCPSRSPSPHKCLLETSFCGSKPTLADNLIEPSKPETDDLEKILLKREADTTKALIPESIKVSMVGGNLKPDPLDKPRRRGREERKEIFKREVEITKRFLEKVNIEVGQVLPLAFHCS